MKGALEQSLANRRWARMVHPFPYFTAMDVFSPDAYHSLEQGFLSAVAGGQSYLSKHDIHGTTLSRGLTGPLTIFTSMAWHNMIASLLGIDATGHLNVGLHHHEVGSANGFVHNDLNPGWFVDYPSKQSAILSDPNLCSYTTGMPTRRGVKPRETIRAASLLFYLANPPWSEGDGGETGLYQAQIDQIGTPAVAIPPINNSLVVFECTPYSFHGFISNRRQPRNSVVMWLHRNKQDVVQRWGQDAIIPYR